MVQSVDYCHCHEGEIKNLSHRYALALDGSDFEEWKELFTEDVVWQTAGRPRYRNVCTPYSEIPSTLSTPKS